MDDITLRDVLLILTTQIEGISDDQKELARNQQALTEATNHKVAELKRQGLYVLGLIGVVAVPVVIDHWRILIERLQGLF